MGIDFLEGFVLGIIVGIVIFGWIIINVTHNLDRFYDSLDKDLPSKEG